MSCLILYICVIVGVVAVDQVTKLLVIRYLVPKGSVVLWDGVFRLTYVENRGAAFGSFSDHRWVFMVISSVAIVALIVYLVVKKPQSKLFGIAVALVIGGGIGNMIDRVRLEFVVDFLDFYAFDFWQWVFNVADACVCVGGGLLILWCILEIIKESRETKVAKLSGTVKEEPERSDEDAGDSENKS